MTAFALLSTYALFVLDPAIFVPNGRSGLLPAALAAPLPQDEGDGSDDDGKQDGGETKEPVVLDLDLNKDESITIDDFDALYLALESPEKFEKQYGKSAAETLKALDVDADGEFTDIDLAEFGAQGGAALTLPVCDSGPARAWGAQMNVATYSSVNLFNGNLLTRIPITAWPSFGPDMDFALYHNAARVTCADDSFSTGFSLGAGWSIAYGGYLLFPTATTIQVVEDDGNVNTFTKSGVNWIAPTGVQDKLEYKTVYPFTHDYWVLTRKNQWRRFYDATGKMVYHADSNLKAWAAASPNSWTELPRPHSICVVRDDASGRVEEIWDSTPCRRLEFHYDTTSGLLTSIEEHFVKGRSWSFGYDPSNRLTSITLNDGATPVDTIGIAYVSGGDRIDSTTDKEGKQFNFDYHADGKLSTVNDPPSIAGADQSFAYAVNVPLQRWTTTYTDRRNKAWSYVHNSYGGLIEAGNPYNQKKLISYDLSRNRQTVTNELNKTWSSTFDARGNRLTLTNPLTQKWAWTYDTYNNVLTMTPPLNSSGGTDSTKQVAFQHNDIYNSQLWDPTNLTQITEPADGQGGVASVTTLTYYHHILPPPQQPPSSVLSSAGQLQSVVDDNDVNTTFTYHIHDGTVLDMIEGGVIGVTQSLSYATEERYTIDSGGRTTETENYMGKGGPGSSGFTANNTPTETTCILCAPCTVGTGDPPFNTYNPVDDPTDPVNPVSPAELVPTPVCNAGCTTMTYDHMGHPLNIVRGLNVASNKNGPDPEDWDYEESQREYTWTYDDLYRLTGYSIETSEPNWGVAGDLLTRSFSYTPDGNGNISSMTDPSGNTTVRGFDDANRLTSVTVNSNSVVTYQYYATSLPQYADYANGVRTEWQYDDAQRVRFIKHTKSGATLLQIEYVYTADGLVDNVVQTTSAGTFNIDYTYDKRNRLIREAGSAPLGGGVAFDYGYTYDGVGNRQTKTDYTPNPDMVWTYHYDVEYLGPGGTPTHATWQNRLLWVERKQGLTLLDTTYYDYNRGGHVKRIVTKAPLSGTYYQRTFQYNLDHQCWLMQKYQFTATGRTPHNVTRTKAREFRYDTDRQRYLERERSITDFSSTLASDAWRDYSGNNIAGDFTVALDGQNDPVATWQKRYDFGLTLAAHTTAGSPNVTRSVHGDLIGSTRLLTDSSGAIANSFATTAFGETLGTPPTGVTRYGYAGSWGYQSDGLAQSDNNFGVMHVGARYHDAGIGRFVQRDPIGLNGGVNLHEYVFGNPLSSVDPSGCFSYGETLSTSAVSSALRSAIRSGVTKALQITVVGFGLKTVGWAFRNTFGRRGGDSITRAYGYGVGAMCNALGNAAIVGALTGNPATAIWVGAAGEGIEAGLGAWDLLDMDVIDEALNGPFP